MARTLNHAIGPPVAAAAAAAAAAPAADDDADALGFAAARHICRRHANDLYLAAFFLRREKRDAVCAVWAFCRMIRDVLVAEDVPVGSGMALRGHPAAAAAAARVPAEAGIPAGAGAASCCGPSAVDIKLALLRERLEQIYEDRLELPAPPSRSEAQHALHAAARTVRRYGIPRQHFIDFAEGCRADLGVRRYATWASLERHCHGVAGVVALALCGVLGVTSSDAGRYARRLGIAIRLTNIFRDLKSDRDRGRLYLPLEDLARHRYTERELSNGVVNDRFRALVRFEIDRAREMYAEGVEGLRWLADDGSRLFASTIVMTHSGILRAIERRGYDVFAARPSLTTAQKFARLPRAWGLARRVESARPPRASF